MKTLKDYEPCKEAYEFYKEHKDFKEAWNSCPRGDWMLWVAYRLKIDKKLLLLTSVKCARTVQHLMKDKRSTDALDVFEAYCNGNATIEEYNKAADAAAAAYAAAAAGAYAARKENRLKTANICRELLTKEVLKLIK